MLPIIAIDGPAGAGKSTVTKLVAQQLGLLFLDTGAMYRAITWLVMDAKIDLEDRQAISKLVEQTRIDLHGTQVSIDDRDVTQLIRTPEVTAQVSHVAALAEVRTALVKQQQAIGARGGIVAEGRDMCTHVFPQAQVKIFLTATPPERARRRYQDLIAQGQTPPSLAELERSIVERDRLDSTRAIAPLVKAADATELITDGMDIDQVVAEIIKFYDRAVKIDR
jgi:pantoate ligase / CMP/dCMP kinase